MHSSLDRSIATSKSLGKIGSKIKKLTFPKYWAFPRHKNGLISVARRKCWAWSNNNCYLPTRINVSINSNCLSSLLCEPMAKFLISEAKYLCINKETGYQNWSQVCGRRGGGGGGVNSHNLQCEMCHFSLYLNYVQSGWQYPVQMSHIISTAEDVTITIL